MMEREIELKLEVGREGVRRLLSEPSLVGSVLGPPRTGLERSAYFDTPDGALSRAGAALRIRESKGRTTQTLKASGGAGGHDRIETSIDLPGGTLRPDLLPDAFEIEGWEELRRSLLHRGLAPRFRSLIRRTAWEVGSERWTVGVFIDRGRLIAGGRSEPVLEVELELQSGTPRDLFDLALHLHRGLPFRILGPSKAVRGGLLAADALPEAVGWASPSLPLEIPARELLRRMGHASIGQFLDNEFAFRRTRAPEPVHQMRVAIRRVRTALTVFRPLIETAEYDLLRSEFGWVLGELGPLRDLDVFLSEILSPIEQAFPEHRALLSVRKELEARREELVGRAMAALESRRLTGLLLETGRWLETAKSGAPDPPAREFATEVLERRLRKAGRGGPALEELPAEEVHRLRIRIKQLRYAAEFFAPLFPGRKTRRFLRSAGKTQDRLGEVNDVAVATSVMAQVVAEVMDGHGDSERARGAGMVLGWHGALHPALLAEAGRSLRKLRSRSPFW